MRHLALALFALAALPTLPACQPVGEPGDACTVTGDGFTRKDSCSTMCVDWEITCPGGVSVTPDVCAGEPCAASGSCGDGFTCMVIDSFAENARCMPVEICGGLPGAPSLPGPAVLR